MSIQLIKAMPQERLPIPREPFLRVSEFFYDTIQGEGIYTGQPSAFLRLQKCTLDCSWCDTKLVYKQGNPYAFSELFLLIHNSGLSDRFRDGTHLVITGGSPLLQQGSLIQFINQFKIDFGFKPFIEIENECTIIPHPDLIPLINCWNNSPKLSNSGNSLHLRFRPNVLQRLSELPRSWFKFVIESEEDWQEIQSQYIDKLLIGKHQIILMPKGATKEEVESNQEPVIKIAIRENVIYKTRLHVLIWGKEIGV